MARETLTRLTFDPAPDEYPRVVARQPAPDFCIDTIGASNLFWQAADGTGAVERLTESPNLQVPNTITPDGSRIVFREITTTTESDLMLDAAATAAASAASRPDDVRRSGTPKITPTADGSPTSPTNPVGPDIYVRPFPDVNGGRWQVSTGGGVRRLVAERTGTLLPIAGRGA